MHITDSQILIWGPETSSRPWPRAFRDSYPEPVGALEAVRQMDQAGVESALLVTPGWELGKNDLTIAAAEEFPQRFSVVGCVDPDAEMGEQVRELGRQPAVRGVRLNFNQQALRGMLHDGRADQVADAAAAEHLPLVVFAPDDPDALRRLVATHPSTFFVVDHANAGKGESEGHLEKSVDRVLPWSQYENLAIKVSAFPCFTSEQYPFPRTTSAVVRLVAEFGAERCMWGSDLHRLPCPYGEWVSAVASLDALTERQREFVMGLATTRVFGSAEPPRSQESGGGQSNER